MKIWSNKKIRYSIIGVGSILFLIYIGIVLTSIDAYYPGTIINGKDYGFKSPRYVENHMYENPADYSFTISFRDKTEVITGDMIGYHIDYKTYLDGIKDRQNPFLWVKTFWNEPYTIDRCIQIDESRLSDVLGKMDELDHDKMISPENPEIRLNDDGVVEAVNDNLGNVIEDTVGLKKKIKELILSGGDGIDVEEEGYYQEPEYSIDNFRVKNCVNYCNEITSLSITYIYDKCEFQLTPEELFSTISIFDDYSCQINFFKVKYLVSEFSKEHDTYGKPHEFRNRFGRTVIVEGGDYGWLIDYEGESNTLYKNLIHKESVSRTPVFENEGYYYDDKGNDIGNFYAEVNLTKQHMYVYKNGRLVLESDVVTGCVNKGRATPEGVYNVDYKQTPAILRGDDYETHVTYWMPFNKGIGFHDATWRGSFGGEIYTYNGSHGCVNMPYSNAQQLFGIIEEGMPVIVY